MIKYDYRTNVRQGGTAMFFIQTVIEFAIAGFIIWALFNESKLIDYEDRIIDKLKHRIHRRKAKIYRRESTTHNKYCA